MSHRTARPKRSILKNYTSSYGMSPNNSTATSADSRMGLKDDGIVTLTPDWEKECLGIRESSAASLKEAENEVYKRNKALFKYFELDRDFKDIVQKGKLDDALYQKVKCPFPSEYDFSDDSDSDSEIPEHEYGAYRNISRRAYEGYKARIKLERQSARIVRRSRILDYLNPMFAKRVCFDTVNKVIDSEDITGLFEETMRMNLMDDGGMGMRHGSVDPSDFSRGRAASPNSLSPTRDYSPADDRLTARYHSPHRLTYGRSKIVDTDSFVICREHRDFEAMYDEKQLGFSPVLPGRIIMVYLSGRKHTWVTLDWLFSEFIEKGDTIIVVGAVNPIHAAFRTRSLSRGRRDRKGGKHKRIQHLNSPEHVKEVSADIMKYCLALADPDLVVKIVVELSIGSTKDILRDMYDLYRPFLIVTAAKRRIETFPAVAWRSSKIGDKLVSTYSVPVILVPAMNMDLFEFSLFAQLKIKFKNMTGPSSGEMQKFQRTKLNSLLMKSMIDALKVGTNKTSDLLKSGVTGEESAHPREDDDGEMSDNSSIDSQSSSDSSSLSEASEMFSIYELKKTCQKIEKNLELQLQAEDRNSPDYYKNLLINVSDASREIGIRMATIERQDGAGASLIRSITGAPTRMKYRSLLDYTETPVSRAKSAQETDSRSPSKTPMITFDDDTDSNRPAKSSLKFAIPSRELSRGESSRKSFSGSANSRPLLQPAISSPQINGVIVSDKAANEVKDKIRRNKFASFFKRGRK